MALVKAAWEALLPDGTLELSISNTSGPDTNGCSVIYSLRCSHPHSFIVLPPARGGGEEIPDGILLPGERRLVVLMRSSSCCPSTSLGQQQQQQQQHVALIPPYRGEDFSSVRSTGSASPTNSSLPNESTLTMTASLRSPVTRDGGGTASLRSSLFPTDAKPPMHSSDSGSNNVKRCNAFFIVCYRRLGDTSGCMRAANEWILREKCKYAAWIARAQFTRPVGNFSPLPPALGEPVRWLGTAVDAARLAGLHSPPRSGANGANGGTSVHSSSSGSRSSGGGGGGGGHSLWIEPRNPVSRNAERLFRSNSRFGAGFVLLPYRPPRIIRRAAGSDLLTISSEMPSTPQPQPLDMTMAIPSVVSLSSPARRGPSGDTNASAGNWRAGQGLRLFAVSESLRRRDGEMQSAPLDIGTEGRTLSRRGIAAVTPLSVDSLSLSGAAESGPRLSSGSRHSKENVKGAEKNGKAEGTERIERAEKPEKDAAPQRPILRIGSHIAQHWAENEDPSTPRVGLFGSFLESFFGSRVFELIDSSNPPQGRRAGPHLSSRGVQWAPTLSGSPEGPQPGDSGSEGLPTSYCDMGMVQVAEAIRTIAPFMHTAVDGTVNMAVTMAQLIAGLLEDSVDILHAVGVVTLLLASVILLWMAFAEDNVDIVDHTMELFQ